MRLTVVIYTSTVVKYTTDILLSQVYFNAFAKKWRTRVLPIRTFSELAAHIVILVNKQPILYKIYALKAKAFFIDAWTLSKHMYIAIVRQLFF